VEQTAALIRKVAQTKPVIAHTNSIIASAAYWLASAANKIYTDGETALVGSIGVYANIVDFSKSLANNGIEVHEFATGRYKALGSAYHAPDADEKQKMQEYIDTLFSFFVDNVTTYRSIPKDTVLKSADGQVFFAADAATRSLTDGQLSLMEITTMDGSNQQANSMAAMQEALAKANAEIAALQAREAARDRQDEEARAAAARETCNAAYQQHLGREATPKELAAYAAGDDNMREVMITTLQAVASHRQALGANLGNEKATGAGVSPEVSAEEREATLLLAALAASRPI
jgi:signal peptide peptidase SppA